MSPADDSPGPLLRLQGISTSQLPPTSSPPSQLAPFLTSILQEAIPLIDSASPESPGSSAAKLAWTQKGTKSFQGLSKAPVQVSERTIAAETLEKWASKQAGGGGGGGGGGKARHPETWACRRSLHVDDASADGTASWDEFVRCFKERHCEAEEAFTPGLVKTRKAARWDCEGVEVDVKGIDEVDGKQQKQQQQGNGGELAQENMREGEGEDGQVTRTRWGNFDVAIWEVRHKIGPTPILRDRVFGVLIVSAMRMDRDEFVVVSLGIRDLASSEWAGLVKEKGVVAGEYTSVERIRRLSGGGGEQVGQGGAEAEAGKDKIEWIMATTSNAGGFLPLWAQRRAVTGVIAKDVALFMGWIAKERKKGEDEKAEILRGLVRRPRIDSGVADVHDDPSKEAMRSQQTTG